MTSPPELRTQVACSVPYWYRVQLGKMAASQHLSLATLIRKTLEQEFPPEPPKRRR